VNAVQFLAFLELAQDSQGRTVLPVLVRTLTGSSAGSCSLGSVHGAFPREARPRHPVYFAQEAVIRHPQKEGQHDS
jgi:hypothetical protein